MVLERFNIYFYAKKVERMKWKNQYDIHKKLALGGATTAKTNEYNI